MPVLTGQWIPGCRVVESLFLNARCLPVGGRVTPRAFRAKAPLVFVLMAGNAARREPHPRTIQIFVRQQRTRRCGNVLRRVARAASDSRVFAVQKKACCGVIKTLRSRIPVNHLKIRPVVIRMAFHACLAWQAGAGKCCVQSLVLLNLRGNFLVAICAPERWRLCIDLVTFDAVRTPAQALMRTHQRAGRNLPARTSCESDQ